MATDPTLQHGGVGSAVVGALCADLEARGCASGEISWVSNLRFYGKCGARVFAACSSAASSHSDAVPSGLCIVGVTS